MSCIAPYVAPALRWEPDFFFRSTPSQRTVVSSAISRQHEILQPSVVSSIIDAVGGLLSLSPDCVPTSSQLASSSSSSIDWDDITSYCPSVSLSNWVSHLSQVNVKSLKAARESYLQPRSRFIYNLADMMMMTQLVWTVKASKTAGSADEDGSDVRISLHKIMDSKKIGRSAGWLLLDSNPSIRGLSTIVTGMALSAIAYAPPSSMVDLTANVMGQLQPLCLIPREEDDDIDSVDKWINENGAALLPDIISKTLDGLLHWYDSMIMRDVKVLGIEERSLALTGIFQIVVAGGSLSNSLRAVLAFLHCHNTCPVFDDDGGSSSIMAQTESQRASCLMNILRHADSWQPRLKCKLKVNTVETKIKICNVSLTYSGGGESRCVDCSPVSKCRPAVASDGRYVYVLLGDDLLKLGSGNNGTVFGTEYKRRSSVFGSDASHVKSESVTPWLAIISPFIYIRSPFTSPAALIVLDCTSLSTVDSIVCNEKIGLFTELPGIISTEGASTVMNTNDSFDEHLTSDDDSGSDDTDESTHSSVFGFSDDDDDDDDASLSSSDNSDNSDIMVDRGASGSSSSQRSAVLPATPCVTNALVSNRSPLLSNGKYLFILSNEIADSIADKSSLQKKCTSLCVNVYEPVTLSDGVSLKLVRMVVVACPVGDENSNGESPLSDSFFGVTNGNEIVLYNGKGFHIISLGNMSSSKLSATVEADVGLKDLATSGYCACYCPLEHRVVAVKVANDTKDYLELCLKLRPCSSAAALLNDQLPESLISHRSSVIEEAIAADGSINDKMDVQLQRMLSISARPLSCALTLLDLIFRLSSLCCHPKGTGFLNMPWCIQPFASTVVLLLQLLRGCGFINLPNGIAEDVKIVNICSCLSENTKLYLGIVSMRTLRANLTQLCLSRVLLEDMGFSLDENLLLSLKEDALSAATNSHRRRQGTQSSKLSSCVTKVSVASIRDLLMEIIKGQADGSIVCREWIVAEACATVEACFPILWTNTGSMLKWLSIENESVSKSMTDGSSKSSKSLQRVIQIVFERLSESSTLTAMLRSHTECDPLTLEFIEYMISQWSVNYLIDLRRESKGVVSSDAVDESHRLFSAIDVFLRKFCWSVLMKYGQIITTELNEKKSRLNFIDQLIRLISLFLKTCSSSLSAVVNAMAPFLEDKSDANYENASMLRLRFVEESVIPVMLSSICTFILSICRCHLSCSVLLKPFQEIIISLGTLCSSFPDLIAATANAISSESNDIGGSNNCTSFMQIMESLHPYPNNCKDKGTITIPGASKVLIFFDTKCSTESGPDVLSISGMRDGVNVKDKFSGSGSCNWRTVLFDGNTVTYEFHSDDSVVSWGWKFTAVGLKPMTQAYPAILELSRLCSVTLGVLIGEGVETVNTVPASAGDVKTSDEDTMICESEQKWLHSSLLTQSEPHTSLDFGDSVNFGKSIEDQFLTDLFNNTPGSTASHFLTSLREHRDHMWDMLLNTAIVQGYGTCMFAIEQAVFCVLLCYDGRVSEAVHAAQCIKDNSGKSGSYRVSSGGDALTGLFSSLWRKVTSTCSCLVNQACANSTVSRAERVRECSKGVIERSAFLVCIAPRSKANDPHCRPTNCSLTQIPISRATTDSSSDTHRITTSLNRSLTFSETDTVSVEGKGNDDSIFLSKTALRQIRRHNKMWIKIREDSSLINLRRMSVDSTGSLSSSSFIADPASDPITFLYDLSVSVCRLQDLARTAASRANTIALLMENAVDILKSLSLFQAYDFISALSYRLVGGGDKNIRHYFQGRGLIGCGQEITGRIEKSFAQILFHCVTLLTSTTPSQPSVSQISLLLNPIGTLFSFELTRTDVTLLLPSMRSLVEFVCVLIPKISLLSFSAGSNENNSDVSNAYRSLVLRIVNIAKLFSRQLLLLFVRDCPDVGRGMNGNRPLNKEATTVSGNAINNTISSVLSSLFAVLVEDSSNRWCITQVLVLILTFCDGMDDSVRKKLAKRILLDRVSQLLLVIAKRETVRVSMLALQVLSHLFHVDDASVLTEEDCPIKDIAIIPESVRLVVQGLIEIVAVPYFGHGEVVKPSEAEASNKTISILRKDVMASADAICRSFAAVSVLCSLTKNHSFKACISDIISAVLSDFPNVFHLFVGETSPATDLTIDCISKVRKTLAILRLLGGHMGNNLCIGSRVLAKGKYGIVVKYDPACMAEVVIISDDGDICYETLDKVESVHSFSWNERPIPMHISMLTVNCVAMLRDIHNIVQHSLAPKTAACFLLIESHLLSTFLALLRSPPEYLRQLRKEIPDEIWSAALSACSQRTLYGVDFNPINKNVDMQLVISAAIRTLTSLDACKTSTPATTSGASKVSCFGLARLESFSSNATIDGSLPRGLSWDQLTGPVVMGSTTLQNELRNETVGYMEKWSEIDFASDTSFTAKLSRSEVDQTLASYSNRMEKQSSSDNLYNYLGIIVDTRSGSRGGAEVLFERWDIFQWTWASEWILEKNLDVKSTHQGVFSTFSLIRDRSVKTLIRVLAYEWVSVCRELALTLSASPVCDSDIVMSLSAPVLLNVIGNRIPSNIPYDHSDVSSASSSCTIDNNLDKSNVFVPCSNNGESTSIVKRILQISRLSCDRSDIFEKQLIETCLDSIIGSISTNGERHGGKIVQSQSFPIARILESDHDYNNNENSTTMVVVPGAVSLIVDFGDKFQTESGPDVLSLKGVGGVLLSFSGRDVPSPVTIPGNWVQVQFVSDGSVVYWGYCISIRPYEMFEPEVDVKSFLRLSPNSALNMLYHLVCNADAESGIGCRVLNITTLEVLLLTFKLNQDTHTRQQIVRIVMALALHGSLMLRSDVDKGNVTGSVTRIISLCQQFSEFFVAVDSSGVKSLLFHLEEAVHKLIRPSLFVSPVNIVTPSSTSPSDLIIIHVLVEGSPCDDFKPIVLTEFFRRVVALQGGFYCWLPTKFILDQIPPSRPTGADSKKVCDVASVAVTFSIGGESFSCSNGIHRPCGLSSMCLPKFSSDFQFCAKQRQIWSGVSSSIDAIAGSGECAADISDSIEPRLLWNSFFVYNRQALVPIITTSTWFEGRGAVDMTVPEDDNGEDAVCVLDESLRSLFEMDPIVVSTDIQGSDAITTAPVMNANPIQHFGIVKCIPRYGLETQFKPQFSLSILFKTSVDASRGMSIGDKMPLAWIGNVLDDKTCFCRIGLFLSKSAISKFKIVLRCLRLDGSVIVNESRRSISADAWFNCTVSFSVIKGEKALPSYDVSSANSNFPFAINLFVTNCEEEREDQNPWMSYEYELAPLYDGVLCIGAMPSYINNDICKFSFRGMIKRCDWTTQDVTTADIFKQVGSDKILILTNDVEPCVASSLNDMTCSDILLLMEKERKATLESFTEYCSKLCRAIRLVNMGVVTMTREIISEMVRVLDAVIESPDYPYVSSDPHSIFEKLTFRNVARAMSDSNFVSSHSPLVGLDPLSLWPRCALIICFNAVVKSYIEYISLNPIITSSSPSRSVFSGKILHYRDLIFVAIRQPIFALHVSRTGEDMARVVAGVNRFTALRHLEKCRSLVIAGRPVPYLLTDLEKTMFFQLYKQLRSAPSSFLRDSRVWEVKFEGEGAEDAGGPYHESFVGAISELVSPALPLFIPCPNAVFNVGLNRDIYVPNIKLLPCSKELADLYAFAGRLIGVAVRTHTPVPLPFASLFWKRLVMEPSDASDLGAIDELYMVGMNALRFEPDLHGAISAHEISGFFTTDKTYNCERKGLLPNGRGADVPITEENCGLYCDLVDQLRLSEYDALTDIVAKGVAVVLPGPSLRLLRWLELEKFVCGNPNIDLALLRQHTTVSGRSESDPVILNFWKALESFDSNHRQAFLRFTWGRSRLPLPADFTDVMVLRTMSVDNPDQYLPASHTCFFQLDLPEYTSYEILREKLLVAITICLLTDTDRDGGDVGWSDNDDDSFE